MVPLNRAMTSFHRVPCNNVSICSGLVAILNAKLLPAANHSRALSYRNGLYSVLTIGNRFLFTTESNAGFRI